MMQAGERLSQQSGARMSSNYTTKELSASGTATFASERALRVSVGMSLVLNARLRGRRDPAVKVRHLGLEAAGFEAPVPETVGK